MPPKKQKAPVTPIDSKAAESKLDFFPRPDQYKEFFKESLASQECAQSAVEDVFNQVYLHMRVQAIQPKIVPYISEDGLSVAMEPSLLLYFTPDDKGFEILPSEEEEPPLQKLDWYCADSSKLVVIKKSTPTGQASPSKKRAVELPSSRSSNRRKSIHLPQLPLERSPTMVPQMAKHLTSNEDTRASFKKKVTINDSSANIVLHPTSPDVESHRKYTILQPKSREADNLSIKSGGKNMFDPTPATSKPQSSSSSPKKRREQQQLRIPMTPDYQVEVSKIDFTPIYHTLNPEAIEEDDQMRKQLEMRPRKVPLDKKGKAHHAKNQPDRNESGILLPKKGQALVTSALGTEVVHDMGFEDKGRVCKAAAVEKEVNVMQYSLLSDSQLERRRREEKRRISKLKSGESHPAAMAHHAHPGSAHRKQSEEDEHHGKSEFNSASKATPHVDTHKLGDSQISYMKESKGAQRSGKRDHEKPLATHPQAHDERSHGEHEGSFEETYLDALNESITIASPEKLKGRQQDLFDSAAQNMGTNTSVFGASTDVMELLKPGNGVKVRGQRAEVGSGVYLNKNSSKMSLRQYRKLTQNNKSLASIAIRGIGESSALLNQQSLNEPISLKLNNTIDYGHPGRALDSREDDDLNSRGNSLHDSWQVLMNSSESPRTQRKKFIPLQKRQISKINLNVPSEESRPKLSQSIDLSGVLIDPDFRLQYPNPKSKFRSKKISNNNLSFDQATDVSKSMALTSHRVDTEQSPPDNILFNDQSKVFQDYKKSRAPKTRLAESPISKYKAQSPVAAKTIFRMKDRVEQSPREKTIKLNPLLASAFNKKTIVEKIRQSQRMLEQKEQNKKRFIDGSKDLHPDDGDHGLKEGFVKRGPVSSLQYFMAESPKPTIFALAKKRDNLELNSVFSPTEVSLPHLPQTTKNVSGIEDLDLNPPSGFKKVTQPILRLRNRGLASERIQMQNLNVNKSLRRYIY